jgi:hypothetical protein
MCRYKIMEKKPLKDQLSDFTYLYFHLYSDYIKVYIFFLVKFCTFGFILKKSAIVATDFYFHSDYMISYIAWVMHIQYVQSWLASGVYDYNTIMADKIL